MIVKNESQAIEKCLASVKNLIDYWVIVDTGSTDGTQKIIKDFLKDIPGKLYQRPWVDFGTNRNEALAFAKKKADYLLFIDADERLEFFNSSSLPPLDKDCYLSVYQHEPFTSFRVLLVDSRFDWKWNGTIHEAVECPDAKNIGFLKEVMNRATHEGHRSLDLKEKFRKDIQLLERVLQQEPQNSRNRFHLAKHYEAVEEYESALKHYEMRATAGGMDAEVFYSLYRIGILQQELGMPSRVFINSFLKAFQNRSWRAEPLYSLAEYFMDIKAYFLGYLITRFAMSLNLVNEYYLTLHKVYDYALLYQYTECSFRVGKYQEAYQGLKRLLAVPALPEDIRAASEKNLSLLKGVV